MPRRSRRRHGPDPHVARQSPDEPALNARINATFKKLIVALQDQRDLHLDLASTKTRAMLLDSENAVLNAEYERALAARDKLEALSRELARQNKVIDQDSERKILQEKTMREEIVNRFNAAMAEINNKLAQQNSNREQRDAYVVTLQKKVKGFEERYEMRQQHFDQQLERQHLETKLAQAKKRKATSERHIVTEELDNLHEQTGKAKLERDELTENFKDENDIVEDSEVFVRDSQELFDGNRDRIEERQSEVKRLQSKNAAMRQQNSSTLIHIKAMETEYNRLQQLIAEQFETERRERTKAEALDKLCKQVTAERSELQDEILVMQEAWTKLKQEIESLKEKVGDSNRVLEILQNIMTRESWDLAVGNIMKSGKTIEDVISDELGHLSVAARSPIESHRAPVGQAGGGRSSGGQDLDPPA